VSEPDSASEPVLVSACLLGRRCTYVATDNRDEVLESELARRGLRPVPFCPEESGGLPTPRPGAWHAGGSAAEVLDGAARVVDENGRDVSAEFKAGAEAALAVCRSHGITRAFLKERSPSCGVCSTHRDDRVVAGPGVTTERLRRAGIECEGVEGRRSAAEPRADEAQS
jgi:uncharacterized protein YbbK (DUF523 family)